jgi:hypothetical protein
MIMGSPKFHFQAVQKRHNISMIAYAAIGSPGRSDVVMPNNL